MSDDNLDLICALCDLCELCDCFCCCCFESNPPAQTTNYAAAPITTQYHNLSQQNQEYVYGSSANHHMVPIKSLASMHGHIGEKKVYLNPEIVRNAKIVDFLDAEFEGEFYETVLKYCNAMKHLSVRYYCETFSDVALKECTKTGVENQWQQQNYSTLEHLC